MKLFEPGKIGKLTLKNRIVMSAMQPQLKDPDGRISQRGIDYYVARAKGGTGLIFTRAAHDVWKGSVEETDRVCKALADIKSDTGRLSELADAIHSYGAKVRFHSCGSVYHYIDEWIDAGIDILNPVQISAVNMEPERLMKDFGGRIVFWGGGCDTQKVLPLGTPEEVKEHVYHNINVFGLGNGDLSCSI